MIDRIIKQLRKALKDIDKIENNESETVENCSYNAKDNIEKSIDWLIRAKNRLKKKR